MLYVVAEDIGSARTFWLNVIDNTKCKGNYIVSDTYINKNGVTITGVNGGKDILKYKIDYLFKKVLNKDDTLFIIIDNIGENFSDDMSSFDFIDNIAEKCKNRHINLITTAYYCFEEVFISYDEIESMYKSLVDKKGNNIANKDIVATLDYIKTKLSSDEEYYDINCKYIQNATSLFNTQLKYNREQFAAALLEYITKQLYGRFHITKGKTGFECMMLSCDEVRQCVSNSMLNRGKKNISVTNYINILCNNKCTYECKNCTSLDKIDNIFKNSILNKSNYDYTYFDKIH